MPEEATTEKAVLEHEDDGSLTSGEQERFDELEIIISEGLQTFMAVGNALAEVKEKKLWRESYDSWDDYTRKRWNYSGNTAYQTIHAAETAGRLEAADIDVPPAMRTSYELRTVDDDQLEVVIERAKERANGSRVTTEAAKQAKKQLKEEQAADAKAPEPVHPVGSADGFLQKAKGNTASTMIAVPYDLDPRAYMSDLTDEKLKYYATPAGVHSVKETAYPLEVIEQPQELAEAIVEHVKSEDRIPSFNGESEHIDWANQTINPLTGCHHTCPYCYARTLATEGPTQYAQGFHPTFHPSRLATFEEEEAPAEPEDVRDKNVFCDSMSDLFGTWVPAWMIQMTLDAVEESGWNGLFLTKYPERFDELDFPENVMIGITVDGTKLMKTSRVEEELPKLGEDRPTTWISAEPLRGRVEFSKGFLDDWVDCVVIGARQYLPLQEPTEDDLSYGTYREADGKKFQQPPREDIEILHSQAREAGCKVYWKDNVERPKELPNF